MNSMCGQRVSSECDEAMTSTQGECTEHEAAQNDRDHVKSAALAAAAGALGLSELPDPISFRSPSFLPKLGSEASAPKAASMSITEAQASSTAVVVEGADSAAGNTRLKRGAAGRSVKKRGAAKQSSNPSQLSQSQIDANWDAL